jgi:hypothetical protein
MKQTYKLRWIENYQKVGTIGLYYLGVLILMVPFAFLVGGSAHYLEASGFQNASLIFYFMHSSLLASLVVGTVILLGYYAQTEHLKDIKIARRARTFYLVPVITLLLSFVAGIGTWTVLQFRSIIVEEDADFALVAIVLGIVSLRVSSAVEGLIFKR